MGFIIIAL